MEVDCVYNLMPPIHRHITLLTGIRLTSVYREELKRSENEVVEEVLFS
jgi:hypothetical protein